MFDFYVDCVFYLVKYGVIVKHGITCGPYSNGMTVVFFIVSFSLYEFFISKWMGFLKRFILSLFLTFLSVLFEFAIGIIFLMFDVRVWDYSVHRYNYKGIVALDISFIFFIVIVLCVYIVFPMFVNMGNFISNKVYKNTRARSVLLLFATCFWSIYVVDFCVGIKKMVDFRKNPNNNGKRFIRWEQQRHDFDTYIDKV